MPRVSMVILTRGDRPDFFLAQLRSCLAQDGVSVQAIVSTVPGDPAIAVARAHGAVVVIDASPGVPSPSQMYRQWNLALEMMDGDWMCGCSGNDVTLPTKCLDAIRMCDATGGKICDSAFYQANGSLIVEGITDLSRYFPYQYKVHASGVSFVSDACLVHRDAVDLLKPFREDLGNYGVYDFWLRAGKKHPEWFVYNPKPEWIYRVDRNSRHMRKQHDQKLKDQDAKDKRRLLRLHP